MTDLFPEDLHAVEKRAMTGDRQAVLLLVGLERSLRHAAAKLLSERYQDGTCDSTQLDAFRSAVVAATEDVA